MNTNKFIFNLVTDIDYYIIINFLDPFTDFITLSRVNKYYYNLIHLKNLPLK
jgi:hypothetical protein